MSAIVASLTVLFLVSSCSAVRPWVEGAAVIGHPINSSQRDSAQIMAIYSDYAVYIGLGPPSPIVGTSDGLDDQYADSVKDYRSESSSFHALLLRPGTYRFKRGGSYYAVTEFPTVDQEGGYTDKIESFIEEVRIGGGDPPDVFLSVTNQSTIIATRASYEFDSELEAGKFYDLGNSDEIGVSRIFELDGSAFFSERTGEPVATYFLNCEDYEGSTCIPVRASFEHRSLLCEKYKCWTKAELMERLEVAKVVLNATSRSNLTVSSGGVTFFYDPPGDRDYKLYSQRCIFHHRCN